MMKMNQNRITSLFNKTFADLPNFSFDNSTEELIFPFVVKTGFVDSTEKGFVFNSNIDNYSRFERIFTGYEAISAIWEDSTRIDTSVANIGKKSYTIGKNIRAFFDMENSSTNFSNLQENSDFNKEVIDTTASMFVKTKLDRNLGNLLLQFL